MRIKDFVKTGRAVLSKAKKLERLLAAAKTQIEDLQLRIRELEADCIRLKSAWNSAYRQAMENGQAFGAERAISDKLEKALERLSAMCDRIRFPGQTPSDAEKAARAALAEVAAIRNQETAAVKTYCGGKPNYVDEEKA